MSETESDTGVEAEHGESVEDSSPLDVAPQVAVYGLAVLSMALGVLVAPEFSEAGIRAYRNPGSSTNLLHLGGLIAFWTLVILGVARFGYGELVLELVFKLAFGIVAFYLASAYVPFAAAVALGLAIPVVLYVHPEWYVVDVAGLVACIGWIAMFGISLTPGLVLIALIAMAVYDAYSVYVSGHMQSLVEGASAMDLPMAFVVPRDLSFSLTGDDSLLEAENVAVLGYGDALFPGILAVSAARFLESATTLVPGFPYLTAPAVGALIGGVVGMVGLHVLLSKFQRAHPALIVLNPAVILGYLAGVAYAGVPFATAVGL